MSKTETAKPSIEKKHGLHLLHQMMRIREFENKAAELYTQLKIRGFLHLYNGEEAVATGVIESAKPEDGIVATYREHGHALLWGIPAGNIMAELYGKQEGCSGGRGGSMHLFDKERKFYGGSAIVGGSLPMSVGLGLAKKKKGEDGIIYCFLGEGAVAEGEFHEAMNLAALWEVPVFFICENNKYAMGTALSRSESETDLTLKAKSYNVPASTVDGMDVLAVEEKAQEINEKVRSHEGPYFLECRTYRFRAHSMFDAELYRDKEEVEEWKQKGPITTFKEKLQEQELLSQNDEKAIQEKVEQEVQDAVEFAENGTLEPVDNLTKHVYKEKS